MLNSLRSRCGPFLNPSLGKALQDWPDVFFLGFIPLADLGAQNALQGGDEDDAAPSGDRAEQHGGAPAWDDDDGIHAGGQADAGAGSDCLPDDAEPVEGAVGEQRAPYMQHPACHMMLHEHCVPAWRPGAPAPSAA